MDGTVIIGTKLETKSFDKQIEEIERELQNIEEELSDPKKYRLDSRSVQEYQVRAEKLKNSLIGLRKQQIKLNENNFFENAGDGISSLIKKTLKWGIALFGIRSAYSFISKSMHSLSQYNQQIGTDLSYIQFAMATALEPLIETIISLAYKLLGIINSISIALFSVDLFANASADRFKSMSKSANQVKKSLAGFDEMNVVQDNSAGAGISSPSVDMSQFTDTAVGEQFKSFWQGVIDFWENDWKTAFDNIGGMWDLWFQGVGLMGEGFYQIFKGVIDVVIGLWNMLVAVFTGNTDKMQEGWDKFIKGIKEIFIGFIDIFIGFVMTTWGTIKGILSEVITAILSIKSKLINIFIGLWNWLVNSVSNVGAKVMDTFRGIVSFIGNIISNILSKFGDFGTKAGQVVGNAFKTVVNAVLKTIESVINTPIKAINKLISVINAVPGINLGTLSTFTLPRLAKGGIVNMPGRGVNYGGANIAERAPEGVIPLTDSQQMEWLGREIGKNVTINATIINSMNGRVLSRELQKIQNENKFAFNR